MSSDSPSFTHLEIGPPHPASDLEATRVLSACRRSAAGVAAIDPWADSCLSTLPDLPDYELLGELGRGGMGVVYKARQKSQDRVVALKMIRAGFSAGDEERARFRSEAAAVASLQHPNIVRLYEIGELAGCPYIALELVEGGSLAERLTGTPLPPREAAQLVQALACAIHYAHERGVVHRDLKPANILLNRGTAGLPGAIPAAQANSLSYEPKITDFGIAKRLGATGAEASGCQTRTGEILGTPSYMAPEQAAGGAQEARPTTDVYALGAILYELLTGRPPFVGPTPMDTVLLLLAEEPVRPCRLQPGLPRDLETICLKCLHKEPGRRYASALALAEDCAAFLAGKRIQARPTPAWERGLKWVWRHPTAAAIVAVASLGLLSLLACMGWYNGLLRTERDEADRQRLAALAAQQREGEARNQESQARLLAERHAQEAGAQRREAEKQKRGAQVQRDQARRDQVKAQEWFDNARDAVDLMLSRVGHQSLAEIPQLVAVRRELLDDALRFYQGFLQEKGTDAGVRLQTMRAYWRVADIRHLLCEHGQARDAFQAAIDLQEQLLKDFPNKAPLALELGELYNNLGVVLHALGQVADAEKAHRRGIEVLDRLGPGHAASPAYRKTLANLHNTLGGLQMADGRLPDAERSYRRTFELHRRLVAQAPENWNSKAALSMSYLNLPVVLKHLGRFEEAEELGRQAVKLLEELTERFPAVHKHRQHLGLSLTNLSSVLHDRKAREATAAARRALEVRRKLVAEVPTLAAYRRDLCHTLTHLLVLLRKSRTAEAEAEALAREVVSLEEKLAVELPHMPDHQSELGGALHNLAQALVNRGALREARGLLAKALVHQRAAVKMNPTHRTYRKFLRNHCLVFAKVLVRLEEHAEAARAAGQLAEVFPASQHDSYHAASLLARCIPLAQEDANLTEAQRRQLTDAYGSRAVALLRQAVQNGLGNVAKLGRLPVLAPLQDRDDFKALLAGS